MNASEFAVFLKEKLLKDAKEFDEILLSLNYSTLENAHRLAGRRESLLTISNSMGALLKEFHNRHYEPNYKKEE